MAGRPKRTGPTQTVFLRLNADVVARVNRATGLLEAREGVRLNQTEAFTRILEAGCAALERTLEDTATLAQTPISTISEISNISLSEIAALPDYGADVPGYGFPEDEDEIPAPASPTNGTGAPAPAPTTQPAIPLALEPAPKTAEPVDVPQATETPEPRKTPMIPTGMQQCPLGHAPYPMSQSECPTCVRERQRSQRTVSQQPEGEVMPVPGYEGRPRHSVVTEDVPAPEARALLVPEKAQDDYTGVQESARQTAIPPYDATKYVLGKLCPQRHEWGTTGQSRLTINDRVCPECRNALKRRKRAEKHQGQPA
jgi:hypothetical protein